MRIPNFFIVGAQKAGTTSLCRYLQEHPQIFISPTFEPGFFAFAGEELDFSGPGDERLLNRVVTSLESYEKLFAGVTDEIAIGEGTTLYLQSEKAAARIKDSIPDAKIIVILRNPVDRAYSAFMHLQRDDLETFKVKDFYQAVLEEEKRINNNWGFLWRYKSMGLYAGALRKYYDHFPEHHIKVYLYEDFNSNPRKVLTDIFNFLEVDEQFFPEVMVRYNVSGIPKSRKLHDFMTKENRLRSFLKEILPSKLKKEIVNYITLNNRVKPNLDSVTRYQMLDFFRQDITQVQEIIDRDLSSWLL